MTTSATPAPTSAPTATPVVISPLTKLALLALFMAADRIEVAITALPPESANATYRDPTDLVADVNGLCQLAAAQDWGLSL